MENCYDIMDPDNIIDIQPEHNLLRRYLHPNPPNFTFIKDDGTICSTCFHLRKDNNGVLEDGLSVDIEHLTNCEKAIINKSKYRLLSLEAIKVQELGLETLHAPEPKNYAHALIKGDINKKVSKKLAEIATLVPYPA